MADNGVLGKLNPERKASEARSEKSAGSRSHRQIPPIIRCLKKLSQTRPNKKGIHCLFTQTTYCWPIPSSRLSAEARCTRVLPGPKDRIAQIDTLLEIVLVGFPVV